MDSDSSVRPTPTTGRMAQVLQFYSASSRPAGKPAGPEAPSDGSDTAPKGAAAAPVPTRKQASRQA